MAKDPAFLFYFSDFLTSTALMTAEELGCYIRILCHLADKGHLSNENMQSICRPYAFGDGIKSHLKIDDLGLYYHPRLEEEVLKRRNYTESRRENAKHMHKHMHNHMEDRNRNENNNTTTQQIQEIFEFFCLTLKKKILLSQERKRIIEHRLREGRTIEELKKAIVNFSNDDWADRHKFCDIVYALGVRNKVDNLDKWLVGKDGGKPVPATHPKTCPECFGNGVVYPQGGGKAVVCWIKY